MSIKPIDFHLTYANTINESKTKQIELNKVKDFNHSAHHQQQVEIKRDQKRINHSEETKGKTINNHQKKHQGSSSDNQSTSDNKEDDGSSNGKSLANKDDYRGLKIDIMI